MDFDDVTSDERVIEFRDPDSSSQESLIAVVIPHDGWPAAIVSLNPRIAGVSADLMEWAIGIARSLAG
ncbi:hypothetical protein [Streptacidiphilus sp. BW17]|uniref:hypothetical protein n=1 Tax=Streptacidiphilus sp. BW17 TaxID=3156274 RepID=UPI003511B19A